MGERRMWRVGMVSKGVHGMVRMTRNGRMMSVVNSMRMVTAVVVIVGLRWPGGH
jgi:hypothetical protein